ncbi:MAG: hypothetical protein JWR21_1185 [Herminiimonas sp.]|nr:hypothetical protein [Herminiimonas sp.]
MLDVQRGKDGSMVVSTQGATFFAHHHYDKDGVLRGGQGGGPSPMYISVGSALPTITGDGAAMVEVMLSMERCRHAENGPVGVLLPEANSKKPIFSGNPKILWNGVPVMVCDPLVSFVNEKLGSTPFALWVFTVAKTVSKRFSGDDAGQISWAPGDGKAELKTKQANLKSYVDNILSTRQSSNLMAELPKDVVKVLITLDHAVVQWGLDSGCNADDLEAARNDAMEAFLVKGIASMIKRSVGPEEDQRAVNALDRACGKVLEEAGRELATMLLNSSTSQLPVATQDKLRALKSEDLSRSKDAAKKRGDVTGSSRNKNTADKPVRAFSHDSGVKNRADASVNPTLSVLYQGTAFQSLPGSLRKMVRSTLNGLEGSVKPNDVQRAAMACVDNWRVANPERFGAIRDEIAAFRNELARGFWRTDLVDVLARSVRPTPLTTASSSHIKPVSSSSATPLSTTSAKLALEEVSENTESDSDDVRTESSTEESPSAEESSSSEEKREVDAGKGPTSGTGSETDDETAPEDEKS